MIAFLRARLDEDAQTARAVEQAERAHLAEWAEHPRVTLTEANYTDRWRVGQESQDGDGWTIVAGSYTAVLEGRTKTQPWVVAGPGYSGGGVVLRVTADYITRHDPARVLRRINTQREMLESLEHALDDHDTAWLAHLLLEKWVSEYADHASFKEEWRV